MNYPIKDRELSPFFAKMQRDAEKEIEKRIKKLQKNGYRAHRYRYMPDEGMEEYVWMIRNVELNTVIELVSEPFDTETEAKHFANVFNDCFLADASYTLENGKYRVYTGWLIKQWVIPYSMNNGQKGSYFMFANWS